MNRLLTTDFFASLVSIAAAGSLFLLTVALGTTPARGHQVWIQTEPQAEVGAAHELHVCWGHSGQKETGPRLAGQQEKLTAHVLGPSGRSEPSLVAGNSSFTARITPGAAGNYTVGADLQVGIIDRDFHGIPAKTRVVMYGTSAIRAGASRNDDIPPLGFDLEIVPVELPRNPKPGDVVTVKVLHRGKPLGGRDVVVTATTSGPLAPPADERIQSAAWSIEAMADPQTGAVTIPLIVGGQHLFSVKYFDETPGTYDGERNDRSEFSHLQKGDTYERTMYVSTFTLQVGNK